MEKLFELVRTFLILYDTSSIEYRDQNKKQNRTYTPSMRRACAGHTLDRQRLLVYWWRSPVEKHSFYAAPTLCLRQMQTQLKSIKRAPSFSTRWSDGSFFMKRTFDTH